MPEWISLTFAYDFLYFTNMSYRYNRFFCNIQNEKVIKKVIKLLRAKVKVTDLQLYSKDIRPDNFTVSSQNV